MCEASIYKERISGVSAFWTVCSLLEAEGKTLLFVSILVPLDVCEIKRVGGKKLNFCRGFRVPGSNLAWVPFICSAKSRLSEIIRARDENSYIKRTRLQNTVCVRALG